MLSQDSRKSNDKQYPSDGIPLSCGETLITRQRHPCNSQTTDSTKCVSGELERISTAASSPARQRHAVPADGAPLSWEETLSDLPEASQGTARAEDARWTFITQQEHPVKRVPMHSIHPCETAKLMSLLLAWDPASKQRRALILLNTEVPSVQSQLSPPCDP